MQKKRAKNLKKRRSGSSLPKKKRVVKDRDIAASDNEVLKPRKKNRKRKKKKLLEVEEYDHSEVDDLKQLVPSDLKVELLSATESLSESHAGKTSDSEESEQRHFLKDIREDQETKGAAAKRKKFMKKQRSKTALELSKLGQKPFTILLHDGQKSSIVYKPHLVLGNCLKKVCNVRNIDITKYIPKDLAGNKLDMKMTLGEIEGEEITFSTRKKKTSITGKTNPSPNQARKGKVENQVRFQAVVDEDPEDDDQKIERVEAEYRNMKDKLVSALLNNNDTVGLIDAFLQGFMAWYRMQDPDIVQEVSENCFF